MSTSRMDTIKVLLIGIVIFAVIFAENQQINLGLVALTAFGLIFLRAVLFAVRLLPDNVLPTTQSTVELETISSTYTSPTTITSEIPRVSYPRAGIARWIFARNMAKRNISLHTGS